MAVIRSAILTCMVSLSTAVFSVLVMVTRLFGYRAAFRVVVVWAKFVIWMGGLLCGLSYVSVGQENLPADSAVVLMKHSSAYETVVQILLFPTQVWVLKRELLLVPFFGWGLAASQPIAVNRKARRNAVNQVIRVGKKRLAEGRWVIIFPEGTRMPAGETRRYGVSGVLLAQAAGKLIVPVAHNAGDFWPRRGWLKRTGTVRFAIGPPVDPAGREPREVNDEVQAWIEAKVAELRRDEGFV